MKRGDLLRARAGEQRRAKGIAFEPVHLALAAGADDEGAVLVEGQVVRRILARFPELIPDAVRVDPVDRALDAALIVA